MSKNLAVIPNTQSDSAWKDILNVWFPEFMVFFYPELSNKIDWSSGYETLDKELQTTTTQAMLGNRFVDKLMNVKSLQGKELWILLHIEIQGKKETHFEKRLFEYYYRLYDRYHIPIVTLAVLSDDNVGWKPSVYQAKVWEIEILSFRFFTVKLLDYVNQREFLEQTYSPFGVIILAQLAAIETQKDLDARLTVKFRLTRKLYDCGLERDAILNLYKFIDWVLTLPKDLAIRYNNYVHQIEEELAVAYITTAEQIGLEKGIQYERTMLNNLLKRRFGKIPEKNLSQLEKADAETMLVWSEKIFDAKTIDEIFI